MTRVRLYSIDISSDSVQNKAHARIKQRSESNHGINGKCRIAQGNKRNSSRWARTSDYTATVVCSLCTRSSIWRKKCVRTRMTFVAPWRRRRIPHNQTCMQTIFATNEISFAYNVPDTIMNTFWKWQQSNVYQRNGIIVNFTIENLISSHSTIEMCTSVRI